MKDKRILILGIFILMALAIGITYAYFSAKIIGSETESTLVFDAGTLGINLDGGNTINGDKPITNHKIPILAKSTITNAHKGRTNNIENTILTNITINFCQIHNH
jgi:hypothetical protein